jgi:hypothetical protein
VGGPGLHRSRHADAGRAASHRTGARRHAGRRLLGRHLLGSRILGFSLDLFADSPAAGETAPPPAEWAETLPHVVELAAAVTHDGALSGCDDEAEFAFGLDLLLDGLEKHRGAG